MKRFAFLVHPRQLSDLYIKYPFARMIPKRILEFFTKRHGPVIGSKITGLIAKDGTALEGYVIAITLTARQMMEDRKLALTHILRAVAFAKQKGVGIVGLGALTGSLSKGGKDITEKIDGIGVTTGRAYTVKTVTDYVKSCIATFGFEKEQVKVAVVGAAGSVGSGCAHLLGHYGIKHFLLVDLERKLETMQKHLERLGTQNPVEVKISHRIADIKDYDIVIAATSSPEAVIYPDDLGSGAIVINDAQPSDISPEVLDRDDVLVIEGGLINTPGVSWNINLGFSDRHDTFCCLGEVLILAHHKRFDSYALGELDLKLIEDIEVMSRGLFFRLSEWQNHHGIIPKEKIERVKKILERKRGNR